MFLNVISYLFSCNSKVKDSKLTCDETPTHKKEGSHMKRYDWQ